MHDERENRIPCIAHYLPHLRPAQRRGLALWVYGTILAQSACQNAVVTAWLARTAWSASFGWG